MTTSSHRSHASIDRAFQEEQFDRIVEAILSGKYSWACLLVLRFAGYNPLHYIPYRTYNRLMKDNKPQASETATNLNEPARKTFGANLTDLNHLDSADAAAYRSRGGAGPIAPHSLNTGVSMPTAWSKSLD